MLNAVKSVLADISSVSPLSEQLELSLECSLFPDDEGIALTKG